MSENEHDLNGEKTERGLDQATVSRVRRHLVKSAVVAAPVVLTLRSGAAMANASAYQCIEADQNKPTPPTLLEPGADPDMWMREPTDCRQLGDKQNSPSVTFFVYRGVDDPDSDSNTWHKADDPSITYADGPGSGKMSESGTSNQFFILQDNIQCDVLIIYNQFGERVGIGPPRQGAGPITGSCWTSVDPDWAQNMGP